MIKYIVRPGYVFSRSDGDRHYISAGQLMNLHRVTISECIIYRGKEDRYKLIGFKRKLINLFPRADGQYKKYNQPLHVDRQGRLIEVGEGL